MTQTHPLHMNTTTRPRQNAVSLPPREPAAACLGKDYDACGTHASSRHGYTHVARSGRLTACAVLSAAFILHALSAAPCAAQERTDNRRLFFSGTGAIPVWDNSTANWTGLDTYLSYVDHLGPDSAIWSATLPSGAAVTGSRGISFLNGDIAVFDSVSDTGYVWTGSAWSGSIDDSAFFRDREIAIAAGGVRASDVVVYATEFINLTTEETNIINYTFTGGGITASPAEIAPGSEQVIGTGVTPTGRLVKIGNGTLTLSNDTNHFAGGIFLFGGAISVTNTTALGDNNIILTQMTNVGGVDGAYGYSSIIGEKLLHQIQAPGGGIVQPAVVTSANGTLLTGVSTPQTLHVAASGAGLDITGDIYIGNRTFTLNIEGDTTISGRIVGSPNAYGTNGGTLIKNGEGVLTLTGTRNWFYGSGKNYSQINEGRVVATTPNALGNGAWTVTPGTVLEFRGVHGTMRQAFIGGGAIEVTDGSDLTFDWRNGALSDFDSMAGNGSFHPAMNELGSIAVSGQSRFTAMASGTYSTVLGGAQASVTITEGSTLVIGREGLSARGSGATKIPMTYAILANYVGLSGGSTLVLNPNAYLSTGALVVPDDSTCTITFGASGVSRLRWQEGVNPDLITTTSGTVRYVVPDGMELIINEIPVPVSPSQSIPADNSPEGWCREYVLVNQGANPLQDIAMTLNALDAFHDTVSTRLSDELVDPVIRHAPARKRKWVNEAWMRLVTSEVDYDARSITTPGVNGRISGAVLGLDGILAGRVLLGLHGGIADNNLDTTNHTSLSSKQKFLGIHAAQRFGKFHLSAVADTGRASTDSFRYENGNLTRGKWDTSYYSGDVRIGVGFNPLDKLMLKPYAGLRYSKLKLTGHYERGLSPLVIGNFDDASAQALYGLAAGYKLKLFKRDFALDLSLARKHAIRSPRETLDTHYFDSPNTPVTLRRGDFYANATAFGFSARAAITRHTLAGLAFDYETASSYNRITGSFLIGCTW